MMKRPSTSRLALAGVLMGSLTMAACATVPGAPASASFSSDDFSWSAQPGRGVIEGRVSFNQDGASFNCAGNVGLIPDTSYTRARMMRLYGSTTRAAVPASVVRARSDGEQAADYRAYERAEMCSDNRFRFTDLPEGSWFIISPVRAGDEITVLMRQVRTRGARTIPVTLGN